MKYKIGDIVRIKSSLDYFDNQPEYLFLKTDAKITAISDDVVTLMDKNGLTCNFYMRDLDKRYIPKKRIDPVILIVMSIAGHVTEDSEQVPFKSELIERVNVYTRVKSLSTGIEYALTQDQILEYMDNDRIVKFLTP